MAHAGGSTRGFFAGLREFVGEVERRQDGYPQLIDSAPLGSDSAHFGVHLGGQFADVVRILSREVIGLIVDLNRDVIGRGLVHHASQFE
jgi:hypothetical protein